MSDFDAIRRSFRPGPTDRERDQLLNQITLDLEREKTAL
jgi:hypothetical protein